MASWVVLLGLALMDGGSGTAARDDSVWLNAMIRRAIGARQTSVTLPSGTFVLDHPLEIPAGTKNFALRGGGATRTVLTSGRQLEYAIEIGEEVLNHNSWGLTNKPQTAVMPSATGDASIRAPFGSIAPGAYVLWDSESVEHRDGGVGAMFRAEIVQVVSYSSSARRAALAAPIGREYEVNPQMAKLGSNLCENIRVESIGFDGKRSTGGFAKGMVRAGLTRGLQLVQLRARRFAAGAILTTVCRNVEMDGIDIASAEAGGPGEGYGIQVSRSRFVTVRNCLVSRMRRGIVMHTGTMDALVENCTATETDFDTHGFDERRIVFRGCRGGSISWGNEAWFAGGRDLTAENCVLDDQVSIGPNVVGATIRGCVIGARNANRTIDLYGVSHHEARRFGAGRPDQVLFDTCTISATETPIWLDDADSTFGKARFVGCTLRGAGPVVRLESMAGELEFDACRFEAATLGETPIRVHNPFRRSNLSLNGCTLSAPGAEFAVWVQGVFPGSLRFTNNRMIAPGAVAPRFVRSEGRVRLVDSGNAVGG